MEVIQLPNGKAIYIDKDGMIFNNFIKDQQCLACKVVDSFEEAFFDANGKDVKSTDPKWKEYTTLMEGMNWDGPIPGYVWATKEEETKEGQQPKEGEDETPTLFNKPEAEEEEKAKTDEKPKEENAEMKDEEKAKEEDK